jgi:hypothetical protein
MNQYKFKKCLNTKGCIIVILMCMLVSYGLFNARNLLIGPTIEIFKPAQNTETSENVFTVNGRGQNIAYISVNEKPISINTEGLFEEKILLSPGSNIIEIKARDRFQKEIKKIITIYYKQSNATTSPLTINQ